MKMAFEIFGDALALVAIFGTVCLLLLGTLIWPSNYETSYEVKESK